MTYEPRPETRDAVELLQEVAATLMCAKYRLLDPADELVVLSGPNQEVLLALAGSTPEALTSHVETTSTVVLDGNVPL